jgi:GNAT superfamily N-acetyltransferase
MRDTPGLVRLYMGLSPAARHAFHPFPRVRLLLWLAYPALIGYQTVANRLMRRHPQLIAAIFLVEADGVEGPLGYGTLRGTILPDGRPGVRYGAVVKEGTRGLGVGLALLRGMGEAALALGITTAVGSCFRSDTATLSFVRRFGFEAYESDWIDPGAPTEKNYRLEADLVKILRSPPAPRPAADASREGAVVVPENGPRSGPP